MRPATPPGTLVAGLVCRKLQGGKGNSSAESPVPRQAFSDGGGMHNTETSTYSIDIALKTKWQKRMYLRHVALGRYTCVASIYSSA